MSIRPKTPLLNKDLKRPSALESIPRNPDLLWLDKNENVDPVLSAFTKKLLSTILPETLFSYPEAGELYNKIAQWSNLKPESLLLTPGSDGAIRLIFEAFVNEGDIVINTSPTFAMYAVYGQVFGASVRIIEYENRNNGPFLDIDKMIAMVVSEKPKLVCLPNPDSPTGTVVARHRIQQLLKTCEDSGSVLLIDEAYYPFYNETVADLTNFSRNLIIARTFAKAFGLAGLRIGYAIANPETISFLHKIRPMYETSTIGIDFMNKMMDHLDEMKDSVKRITEGRTYFVKELRSLGFQVIDTNANFIHVDFHNFSDKIHTYLSDKVLYRNKFDHPSLPGYSRFSVGPKEVMMPVIDWIKQAIKFTI
jgi:histidinol-phosphate aminotransferase